MEAKVRPVELRDLWQRWRAARDQRARERLIVAYSPLVKYVAGRLGAGLPNHVEQADLISYGLVGLIGAIERYDPDRETRFETYALQRIRGSIIDELRALDWVPRAVRTKARDVAEAHARLESELGRTPTEAELARLLGVELEELRRTLLEIANSSMLALDELWGVADPEGGRLTLLDTISDPGAVDPSEAIDAVELKQRVGGAIESLPERERLVISLYYYEHLTLRQIGEVLGVTESRISQLHTKALLGMRSSLDESI